MSLGARASRPQMERQDRPLIDTGGTPADASPADIRPTGKWVARLRRRCGLTVAQFAARLGVSVVTVYRWEATPGRLNLHTRPLNTLTALYRRSGKAAG